MVGRVTVSVTGFRELDARLRELPNRTRKAVLIRAEKKALRPMRDAAEANAPRRSGHLANSFTIDTRLSARQAGMARGTVRSTAEVHLGPSGAHGVWNYAAPEEFGWIHGTGHFALTRAYEAHKAGAVDIVRREVLAEIEKALRRGSGR